MTVEHAEHNHGPVHLSGCTSHRQTELEKPEVRAELEKEWRKDSKVGDTLKGLRMNQEQPIFKPQDLWNYNRVLKAAALGVLTPTQALLKYLTESPDWYVDHQKTAATDVLEYLFFTPECCQKLLAEYYEVLIMDCTYKTNKYKMPLLIITGVTSSNTTFYVAFCFMKGETFEDYLWVIRALIRLLDMFKIPYLTTAISDGDKALAPALYRAFEEKNHRINHILCVWHINQNVTANCKKYFPIMEQWEAFYKN